MPQKYINIYQKARLGAGLTQERAAELIGISVESIRAYETGVRIPPDDAVTRMVEIYNTQFLAVQHLRARSELAQKVMPKIEQKCLAEAVLCFLTELEDVEAYKTDLMRICRDGVISDDERALMTRIEKEVDEACEAWWAVKYAI